jgi:NADH:ubiquinone oxidoreductase subunit 6 (subunit J)
VTGLPIVALLWLLAAVAVVGALAVVFAREVMRMALGLGAFLLALAGLFAYFGFGFLALAELFVYVGGVLILILFAIMLVHRTGEGTTQLSLRAPFVPAAAAVLVSGLLFWMLLGAVPEIGAITSPGGPSELAADLLGPLLPQFEIAGALLLVALVAVVLVSGGERE